MHSVCVPLTNHSETMCRTKNDLYRYLASLSNNSASLLVSNNHNVYHYCLFIVVTESFPFPVPAFVQTVPTRTHSCFYPFNFPSLILGTWNTPKSPIQL